ncbi:MAG: DNA mismatch repair endonuclease MutL [Hydrogenothermaceae bacterium]|nr:DNA mismatch repair endonuclease MutL [Hydrogenothermaceae bacterium]
MKIKQLPEEVIRKIAAGEIVERPANIIKELIENSIDANSTCVEVYVQKAGKREITVIDNGDGIEREDLLNAVKKHHTSKIRSIEDLYSMMSHGFRGEALYSISSASKLRIISRTKGNIIGNELYMEEGNLKHLKEVGSPVGTKVSVLDLFYNLPARRKFLKTDNTENFHNLQTFLSYAISNSTVHFKYSSDGITLYNLYPTDLKGKIKQVFNREFTEIDHESITGKINMFFSPQKHRVNYIFVNKRPVKSLLLYKALKEFFGDGFYILFLEVPPYTYDINIHPSKLHIKFQNDRAVINLIKSALERSLWKMSTTSYILSQQKSVYSTSSSFEIVGVIEGTFILAYWNGEIYFIDFHVASERIMYEILKRCLEKEENHIFQNLVSPLEIDLSKDERERLFSLIHYLNKVGYRFNVGDRVYITAVPFRMETKKGVQALYELLNSNFDDPIESVISKVSCRISPMSGDKIELEEAKTLLEEWIKTDNPYLCPHGRPIYYKISMDTVRQAIDRK